MKERPLLFSGPMVRAILDGSKTQTRRIVTPQPVEIEWFEHQQAWVGSFGDDAGSPTNPHQLIQCPYGTVGTRLWVREDHYRSGHWEPIPGVTTKGGRQKWQFVTDRDGCLFEMPDGCRLGFSRSDPKTPAWYKRLGRFMPRALSRIDLEVTAVRVERLNDISEKDAIAEVGEWNKGPFRVGHTKFPHSIECGRIEATSRTTPSRPGRL